MKVLFLSRYQNTVNRGVETVVIELTKRLSKYCEVEVLSGKDSDSLMKILESKPDIVVPLNGRLQSFKVSLGRILGKYKVIIGGHSGIGKDDIFNILFCKPDLFIALTKFQERWAKKWAWGSKVITIYNGVDLDKFKPNGVKLKTSLESPIILSVGALTWYKYHERVINAVSRLSKGSVLIVGQGEEYSKLKELGSKLLGEKRFEITSFPYERMPDVYRSVDLFTLPSWNREIFGVVYLEAMASGLGVVAPDDPIRREIIGEGGLYVETDNIDEYAKVIERALSMKLKDKAITQAKKFSWDEIALKYYKCFQNLI